MNRDIWIEDVFRPLAVGGMIGCIALSLVHLIQLFFPSWNGTFLVVSCVAVALEANYSYRLVRSQRLSGLDRLRFGLVEIAVILISLRAASYIGDPWSAVLQDIRAWPQDPLRVFDLEVMYAFLLALLSWSVSTQTTSDLERIGEPPVRDKYYVPPVRSLVNRFFWGGAMLLWTAGLTRVGISSLINLSRPPVPGIILNVLIYFVLGLLVLGQIRFTQLSLRWHKASLEVPQALAGRWIRYTLVLLTLAGLVAFLLPTAYTLPLLDVAAIVVQALLYAFNVIFQLVLFGFLLLLTPLARLFGGDIRTPAPDPGPPPELRPPTPNGSTPAWFEILRAVVFWAFAFGVAWYIVRSYLRDRPELMASLKQLRLVRSLRRLVRAFWRQVNRLLGAARERIPQQLTLLRKRRMGVRPIESKERARFFSLRGLSRRQRMLYYYLSILRRAARRGYPRSQSQTPYEYDTDLGPSIPQARAELNRLTEAFVEMRYSTHEVDEERERSVRADWKTIRAAVRSLSRPMGSDEEEVDTERRVTSD